MTMPIIKHILFPFDFSEQGAHATPFVKSVASRFEARLTLLSVLPPVWDFPTSGATIVTSDHEMEGNLRSRLDQALTKELDGIPVQRETTSGDPGFKIA